MPKGVAQVEMGQQFDDPLTLGKPAGTAFDATGLFVWDDCYFMSIFIFQSSGANDSASASGLGKPVLGVDPDPANKGRKIWTLQVKVAAANSPGTTRLLKAGPALAVATAVIRDRTNERVVQWGQYIQLA